jgi:hypothetical protein
MSPNSVGAAGRANVERSHVTLRTGVQNHYKNILLLHYITKHLKIKYNKKNIIHCV